MFFGGKLNYRDLINFKLFSQCFKIICFLPEEEFEDKFNFKYNNIKFLYFYGYLLKMHKEIHVHIDEDFRFSLIIQ